MKRRNFLGTASAATAGAMFGFNRENTASAANLEGDMKITDLKIIHMASWVFVKIETDAGIHGIGEASLQGKHMAVKAQLEDFKRFVIGKDPFQIVYIWTSLHRHVVWSGGPVTMCSIGAIDQALSDIKAKALGVPVYELYGGKVREKVRMYANGWPKYGGTPEGYARGAKEIVAAGYTCMKLYPFTRTEYATRDLIQLGVDRTQAVREAVGPEIELAIDIRSNLNIRTARRVTQMLEPFDIAWLEEPLLFDNQDAMAALARETKVPIATGEQMYTRWEFRELLEKNVVSIIQPDISHAGGISEVRKIAAMAEAYYVEVCPHCSTGPIAWIASLHLDMCTPNNHIQELQLYTMERHKEMLTNPFEIRDGYCTPPQGPGWGTDLREDLLEKYPPTDYTPVGGAGSY